jgi:hypothetical protein
VGEINKSGVESIYFIKPVVSRRLVVNTLVFALFMAAAAYLILIAHQQQQTLSIVIRPCGNDSSGM